MDDLRETIYDKLASPKTQGDLFYQIPASNTEIALALKDLEAQKRILIVGLRHVLTDGSKSILMDGEKRVPSLAVGHFGGAVCFRFESEKIITVKERALFVMGYGHTLQSYTMEEYRDTYPPLE